VSYAEKINAHSGKHLRELRKRKRVFKKFENVTEVMDAYGCYTKYKRAHNHEAYVVPDNPSQYQKIFDLSLKVETKPLDLAGKTYLAPLTTVTSVVIFVNFTVGSIFLHTSLTAQATRNPPPKKGLFGGVCFF
jgi:hypothetical protein